MLHIILAVDDDELILNTYKKKFATWDIEIYTAKDPVEAKEVLSRITPDLVLLDLLLTKDDGSSGIIDYMKGEARLQNIPILIMTNLEKPELKKILLAQGIKEYLIKGETSLDDLYNKVMGYLEPNTAKTDNK
jgi:chemosensory pili system protein ChpA (sensor histidine kinase/response regulator)